MRGLGTDTAGAAVKLSRAYPRATGLWDLELANEENGVNDGAEPVSSFGNCVCGLLEALPTE